MSRVRVFIARVARDERVRFLAVGATNTLIGFLLFAALEKWVFGAIEFGYFASLVVSYTIALTIAFVLYRRFVFRVRGNVVPDFIRFVSVYAVSIGVNFVALPFLVELVHLSPIVSQAIVLLATTLISFFGHKYFSFRRKRSPGTPET